MSNSDTLLKLKSLREIDPEYFRYKKLKDYHVGLAFIWVHEISHVLRQHWKRAQAIEQAEDRIISSIWNIAADLEINDSHWIGIEPPDFIEVLKPEDFELPPGKTAEFYYYELENKNNEGHEYLDYCLNERNFGEEGSGVTGEHCEFEKEYEGEEEMDKEKTGNSDLAHETPQKLSDAERTLIENTIKEYLKQHVNALKHDSYDSDFGLQAGLLSWAETIEIPEDEIEHSTSSWRGKLKARMRRVAYESGNLRLDYNYQKPHRRSASYYPIIMPRPYGALKLNICVILDTSGSMLTDDKEPLKKAVGEVLKIIKDYDTDLTLIPCDAQAFDSMTLQKTTAKSKIISNLKGGGGTNMIAGIDKALNLKPKPDIIVVITDGDTPYPQKKPETETVFCFVNGFKPEENENIPDWVLKTCICVE